MDCVKHPGTTATAYCQNCGKPLCQDCISAGLLRYAAGGQILCPDCIDARQAAQPPFVPPQPGTPNPALATFLGFIPGVGAMYNGQFIKGLIHVVVFVVLIGMAERWGIFGIFIAAWIVYQAFEAHHTAKAMRDGLPLPDPFGLNDLSAAITNSAARQANAAQQPPVPPQQPTQGATYYQYPNQPPFRGPMPGGAPTAPPYVPGEPPMAPPPGYVPPPQPVHGWRRPEPIGAIVLIVLGVLFLLGQLDLFEGRLFEFTWPVLLIALGVWLVVRRLTESNGGPR